MCGDKDNVGPVTKITFEIAIFGKSLEARRVKPGDKINVDNSLNSQGLWITLQKSLGTGNSVEVAWVKPGDKDHVDNFTNSQGAVDNLICPRNQTEKASWEKSRWGSCEDFYVVGSVGSGGSRGSGDLRDVRDFGGLGLSLR